jgi:hypothetical protein
VDELEEDEDDPLDELEELELEDDDELELDEELDEEELEEEEDELELDELLELELDELLELELDELPEPEDEPVGVVGVAPQPTRKAPAAVDAAPDNSNRNSRRSGVSSLMVGGDFLLAMI